MALSKDLVEYLEDFGLPKETRKFEKHENDGIPAFLPDDLEFFLDEFGRAIFEGGRLQTCHPDDFKGVLALIFGSDKDFSHTNCCAYAYSSIREIYCWHENYGLVYLDLMYGTVNCRLLTKSLQRNENTDRSFIVPFGAEADSYDINGAPLFKRAVKKLGPLEIGECYGFFPALALGGSPELEYLKRVRAAEHFAIVAQTLDFNLIDIHGTGNQAIVRPIG